MNWNTEVKLEQGDTLKYRICWEEDGLMISPCNCSGSVSMVHEECMTKWITKANKNNTLTIAKSEEGYSKAKCELCKGDVEFLYDHQSGCLTWVEVKERVKENRGGFVCMTAIIVIMLFIEIILVTEVGNMMNHNINVFGIIFLVVFDLVILAAALRFTYTYVNTYFRGETITIHNYKKTRNSMFLIVQNRKADRKSPCVIEGIM